MSDIYYCSNAKNKKCTGGDTKISSASDKAPKTINNNSSSCRENNNICGKHSSNGKTNWNTKVIQNNPNGSSGGHMAMANGNGVAISNGNGHPPPSSTAQKAFHNTRCTRHHKTHHSHHNGISGSGGGGGGGGGGSKGNHNSRNCSNGHVRKSESVLSTDSDIRFTRRKLGDSQKCGCAVIAGFLVALLVAGAFVYIGYTYFKPEPLPDRTFRGHFRVMNDKWSMDLADQNSLRFQHKARDYRERINLIIRRSDLRDSYEGSEILALDGTDDTNDVLVHFNLIFDPYAGLVSTADLLAIFAEEINAQHRKYFTNVTIDPDSLTIQEVTGLIEEPVLSSSPLAQEDDLSIYITTTPRPPRRCEPLKLNYCRSIGYNMTTYPNLLGHMSFEEVHDDVIAFREMVDAECFREAFDFVCRLLQPPCETRGGRLEPMPGVICREYCQQFMKGCGNRLLHRFKKFFDCEMFPESTGMQSCHHKPHCSEDLRNNAQSPRLCDGYADCPDISDERACTFCPANALYCGRGRACVARVARCDGKADCPDGSDEKDCLSIAPLAADLSKPDPLVPYLPRFHSEGYAVFSEKGVVGKLCAEGLEGDSKAVVRQTVAESLCKSLGYESVQFFEVRNDTEYINDYVRVLDPHAAEISFIRTLCPRRHVLYIGCGELQCGVQSLLSAKQHLALPKMASAGDWPWLVSLYREDTHVCDGTLISRDWVLTTESCFQGQPRATWMAIFGSVRLSSNAPWTQRRRIIGLIKSPVEGSTAALIRLETPVVLSDHVRPICLPDELNRKQQEIRRRSSFMARAEKLETSISRSDRASRKPLTDRLLAQETQQFFMSPALQHSETSQNDENEEMSYGFGVRIADALQMPRAEALKQQQFSSYPLPERVPQVQYYSLQTNQPHAQPIAQPVLPESYEPVTPSTSTAPTITQKTSTKTPPEAFPLAGAVRLDQIWKNCNTLGWARQRDHLQRVQLKIGDMAPCENISIATVNSMCTEATYQKHDCSQEEFSGAPVQCLIPETNQWALIGVSSWRIACAPTGIERPRMYDKITSNAAWIRDTINAV